MKEDILKLRKEGKTYNEIKLILGCSKGTISYHCGCGQKEMTTKRRKKRRENILIGKVENFKYRETKENNIEELKNKEERYAKECIRKFQKKDLDVRGQVNKNIEKTFNWVDILNKFGEDTYCYLSGIKINLYENNYNFDHIIPASRGGDNTITNLGILHKKVNKMKSDMTPSELIEYCKIILEFNGYNISKND